MTNKKGKRPTYVAAGILLETTKGTVLLQQRENNPNISNPGKIGPFGGGIEKGESPEDSAVRELKEEVNLTVSKKQLIPLAEYHLTGESLGRDLHCWIFVLPKVDPNKITVLEGTGYVAIGPTQNIENMPLTDLSRIAIQDYRKGL